MERIELPVTQMLAQVPVEVIEHYLELHDRHIRWVLDGHFKEYPTDDDDKFLMDEPMEEVYHYIDETYKRMYLVGVAVTWQRYSKLWKVEIGIRGQDSLKYFSSSKNKATQLADKIREYLIKSEGPVKTGPEL